MEEVQEIIDNLTQLLVDGGMSERRLHTLRPIIENVAWMQLKLEETRESIKGSQCVIPYDNGGGQKGLRENPLFKGYESLWKSYMAGMSKIIDSLPNEEVKAEIKTIETPKTMLELVRDKHRKEA